MRRAARHAESAFAASRDQVNFRHSHGALDVPKEPVRTRGVKAISRQSPKKRGGVMSVLVFDTHAYVKKLEAVGFSEEQAEV